MDQLRSAVILFVVAFVAGAAYAVLAGCRQAWKDWEDEPEQFRREPGARCQPGPPGTYLRPYLSAENYRSLVVDHCQLVGQFENLLVVMIQLWEMNNALRERLDLPRQPLPIAGSLACAARTAALTALEPTGAGTEEATGEGWAGLVAASSFEVLRSTSSAAGAAMPPAPANGQ